MARVKNPKIFIILALLFVIPAALTACNGQASAQSQPMTGMAPLDQMPQKVKDAPVKVQQAYRFAAANPDIMQQIPCYCGCGKVGHKSNYDCYVDDVEANGKINFDTHALGCSICVDITQDTMRMLKEGKSIPEIKAAIDQSYSQYGPSNMK